jgi:hypothetical protein
VIIRCESLITHVDVHARGALVTRRVSVAETLPDGDVTLAIDGVTPLMERGSVRVSLPDGAPRLVRAVRASLVVPTEGEAHGASVTLVRTLEARIQRLRHELDLLSEQRSMLGASHLTPGALARANEGTSRDVVTRTRDALATSAMLSTVAADVDARGAAIEAELIVLERDLEVARLAYAQSHSAERMGDAHPTHRITVQLTGDGALTHFDLTYAVPAARWWPTYTLRIREQGRRATWLAEALVAQRSGEDWSAVVLTLSTSDLLFDARLPELASLRLGKVQTPRRNWRSPPIGLEQMFEGYDRAFVSVKEQSIVASAPLDAHVYAEHGELLHDADDEVTKAEALIDARSLTRAGAAPATAKRRAMSMEPPPAAARSTGAGVLSALGSNADFGGGGPAGAVEVHEEKLDVLPIEPADAWFDFDTLTLHGADDRALRGRLSRTHDARTAHARDEAKRALDAMSDPRGARDPLQTRGMFDHSYQVQGVVDAPSDGQTYRVSLGVDESDPTLRWRTAPREGADVYREAELRNPFDAPLLAGPVDVYVDGSLLAVASIEHIDRGGTLHVGMGVEQRMRVARNVRVREETAGILGGDTVVHHDVSIELVSALGTSALVEVLDRLPVSDDKTVEVTLTRATPEHERYTQVDRGAPIRGGMLWKVIVPSGTRASVEYAYRVTFPSKNEVVGGNRRD